MVLNLKDITKQEDRPRFVSRRQRSKGQQQEPDNVHRVRPAKRAKVDDEPEATEKPPTLPLWRVRKEQQAREGPSEVAKHKKWFEKSRAAMSARDWRIMRSDLQIVCAAEPNLEPLLAWTELPDAQLSRKLTSGPYKEPTPIQRATIPLALTGSDIIGIAQTGSGKTLGYAIPLLISQAARPLILAPTRELALQIASVVAEFASLKSAEVVTLVGGRDFTQQSDELAAKSAAVCSIIVATPGRLLDFTRQKLLSLNRCSFLVLDEADRMIDLGFEDQIAEIMAMLPERRQTLMFTATWPPKMQELAAKFSRSSETRKVEVGALRQSTSVAQTAELVESPTQKLPRAVELVRRATAPVIVFVATKASADEVAARLPSALALHGALSQERREAAISALREGQANCIVATDIASRGIDVPNVGLVLNYDLPGDIDTYIHRIGRTGRAGRHGKAISLCAASDSALFKDLRRVIRESGSTVPAFLM